MFRLVVTLTLSLLLASWLPAATFCSHAVAAVDAGAPVHAHDNAHDDAGDEQPGPGDCPSAASIGCSASLILLARVPTPAPAEMRAPIAWPPHTLHDRLQPQTIFRPPIV